MVFGAVGVAGGFSDGATCWADREAELHIKTQAIKQSMSRRADEMALFTLRRKRRKEQVEQRAQAVGNQPAAS